VRRYEESDSRKAELREPRKSELKKEEEFGRRSRECFSECFIRLSIATHQALDRLQESTVKEEAVKEPIQREAGATED
jgi:hypothetical protein